MEPGDGDDVRAALESLERRRSSSNGSNLQAAPEFFGRQRLAGGAGASRTATACGQHRRSRAATACGQHRSSSDGGRDCGRRRSFRDAERLFLAVMMVEKSTGLVGGRCQPCPFRLFIRMGAGIEAP